MNLGGIGGAGVRRLDRVIWTIIGVVAALDLAAASVTRFSVTWRTFAVPAAACLVLGAGVWFYTHRRKDPRLASALVSAAQAIAFAAVGAPLSYLAAAADLPLRDHALDAVDGTLGLHWTSVLAWMNHEPTLFAILRPIYLCVGFQMIAAILTLAFSGRLSWLRVYTLAFIFAALVTIAISAVLPAAGAWPYYGLTAAGSPHILPVVSTSWPVFDGLRHGSVRALVAAGAEGIVTFPSLHAALAVILIAALWPVRILRWVMLALNLAVLAATPIDGSHYFVDVFAGAGVAVPCLLAARALARWAGVYRTTEGRAGTSPSAPLATK